MGPGTRGATCLRRRVLALGVAAAAVVAVLAGVLAGEGHDDSTPPNRIAAVGSAPAGPGSEGRVAEATALAMRRRGRIAFAVTDAGGRLRGFNAGQPFVTASVVKAMLLVADLSRATRAGKPLSPADRATLRAMIRVSDNEAANAVYRRVADAGLRAVARRSHMRAFQVGPTKIPSCRCIARRWARAQITAADQARFMRALPRLVPAAYRGFARATLAAIVPAQRWGIPEEIPTAWTAYFKVGVRETGLGMLVHQVARLETDHSVVTLAVLTDGAPTEDYGKDTVRGLTRVLVGRGAR